MPKSTSAPPAITIQISALTCAARIGSASEEPERDAVDASVTTRRTWWMPGWLVLAS